jgi:hypothetical protein
MIPSLCWLLHLLQQPSLVCLLYIVMFPSCRPLRWLLLLPFPPAAGIVLAVLLCHVRQVMSVLESFAQCGVLPAPSTVDHLVLQLVQGGLQHAPVQGMADLLDILAALQHTPGKSFVKMYAHVSGQDGHLLQGWVRG